VTVWYEKSFGRDYLALYPHRNAAEARSDVAAIADLIDPPKDEPLLDLCCGAGRHLLALHEAGFDGLTGIDLSQSLLDVARQQLDAVGGAGVRLLRSDMREIPFSDHFATILSLFTSFGYFSKTEEDEAVLRAARGALRPGGTFLMDTLNRAWTVEHLIPRSEETIDGVRVAIRRALSPDGLRVEKETRVETESEPPKVYHESVRMYTADEMRKMLVRSGFVDARFFGGLDGRPYGAASPRLIAVANRGPREEGGI